jgi:uncharacterized membrane protein
MDEAITKSSTGMEGNIAGALAYAFGWVSGVVFLIIEKDSRFVRFHAMQSILTSIAFGVVFWILRFIPFIGWIFAMIIALLGFGLWLLLMFKAYKGEMFKLPIVGDIAAKQMDR